MGVYTHDSSICKAAIHSGILQYKGGGATVVITYGQDIYNGGLNRGIESVSGKYHKKSFFIVKSNNYQAPEVSIHKQWALINYFAPVVGLIAPYQVKTSQPALKANPTSFM